MAETLAIDEAIQTAIQNHEWLRLAQLKNDWPEPLLAAPSCAEIITELDKKDQLLFFRALPADLQVELIAYLEPQQADSLLIQLNDAEARAVLEELEPDDRAALLDELPGPLALRLLSLLDPAEAKQAINYWGYPEDSVGRLMTPRFIKVKPHWTCRQALEHIRRRGQDIEYLETVFVTELGGKLIDAIPLERLVLARPETEIKELLDYTYIYLNTHDDREKAVQLVQKYGKLAIPVVDSKHYLVGVVTFDDVMDVAYQEDTEDFQRTAAIKPLQRNYWATGILTLVRSRVGWLIGLVFVNLISSSVIGFFEELLLANVVLAFFLPLLADTAGNTGAQASTLLIRALSTQDVHLGHWGRVLGKELLVGLLMGVALGAMGFGLGWFRGGAPVGLVVFATVMSILIIANLVGAILPFVLTALKQDPAVASGPLVTTIMDILGLLIYFGWAVVVLGGS